MKKVLIITYYWPPASGPGVQRYLKFAKYLPEFGWKPYIITVKNGSYSATDETLLDDVPDETEVLKTKTIEPFSIYNILTGQDKKNVTVGMMNMDPEGNPIKKMSLYARANLFIPDARKGWNNFAIKAAKNLIEKEEISTVITTGPPHSTHLVGLKLKKQLNIKWIADFRDPWTNIFYNEALPRTASTQKKDKKLEDSVLKNADKIIVTNSGLRDEFLSRTSNIDVIYNGFDDTDLQYHPWEDKNRKFTIAHVGSLLPGQNIHNLWDTIKELHNENEDFASKLQLSFTGRVDQGVLDYLANCGLEENIEQNGFVPHKEAIKYMMTADLLLFIVPDTQRNHMITPGKLFEYIASRTHILSIGPVNGNISEILKSANREPMIDFNDRKQLKQRLLIEFTQWENADKQLKHEESDLEQFSRKGLTKKLVGILDSITVASQPER